MAWRGKAVGASIGVLAGGPVGALVGLFLGHLVDAAQTQDEPGARTPPADDVQEAFFRCAFQVMGHVAKADGRVSEAEIQAARAAMAQMRLDERRVQAAIEYYRAGKASDFPLDATVRELYRMCAERPDLCRAFVQLQLQTALAGEALNAATRKVLLRVSRLLDVSSYELVQMEAVLRLQRAGRDAAGASPPSARLDGAYAVLGVTREASDADVTRAYRRLMNRNHPDKLQARGASEAVLKNAAEKTRQIRAAYELIREARGMK
jgi:DnaJ like chaperone protein